MSTQGSTKTPTTVGTGTAPVKIGSTQVSSLLLTLHSGTDFKTSKKNPSDIEHWPPSTEAGLRTKLTDKQRKEISAKWTPLAKPSPVFPAGSLDTYGSKNP
jgi:hypothetical protein